MVAETLTKTRKDDLVPKGKERCNEGKGCITLLRLKDKYAIETNI